MHTLDDASLDRIFRTARTHHAWLDRPVEDATLRDLWNLVRWGPTSANCSPLRVVFVKSPEAKAKLLECMAPGNLEKTRSAPVTAILAMHPEFHEFLPKLFPHTDARSWFTGNQAYRESTAFRNSSIQGGYFILAARALGLDCGPMSGFDAEKVDRAFFVGRPERVNFLCNLGYGDASTLYPRSPRFEFDEACEIA